MNYETPELSILMPTINAIQGPPPGTKGLPGAYDGPSDNEFDPGYEDWE